MSSLSPPAGTASLPQPPGTASVWQRRPTVPAGVPAAQAARPLIRLATFAALGAYGILRWSTLLEPSAGGRLFAMLLLAVGLAACGALAPSRVRSVAIGVAGLLALLLIAPLAGVPLKWVLHLRVSVTANAIGQGVSALPHSLVPYTGPNDWIRTVNLLGAGLLLLCAGLVLALGPRRPGDLRRAGAALPLIALAVIPSTVARPQLPYVQGILLFGLIAALVWGERIRRDDLGRVLGACAVAGAAAMVAAPALDSHRAWLDYNSLVSNLTSGRVEAFDWSQRYGPLNWPRTGRRVLSVQAAFPDYWKAEDLDLFDGRGWVAWTVDNGTAPPAPDASALRRWTQTLKVTVDSMNTSDLIGAGFAAQPSDVPTTVLRGASPGTWSASSDLGPGDSYSVRAYTPQPSAAQLAGAGEHYPVRPLNPYLTVTIPQPRFYGATAAAQEVEFQPFGSGAAPDDVSDSVDFTGLSAVQQSPYAPAYRLAARLASHAATPYAYVSAVMRYLSVSNGFNYSETPPVRQFPLESFLFTDKTGYCQQFAGAMALLLRMGGIPARVAAGFATGSFDSGSHSWAVTDIDAHAWVEAWFPHYGWVRFDPTPAAAPARGGRSPIASGDIGGGAASATRPKVTARNLGGSSPTARSARSGGGPSTPLLVVLGLLAAAAIGALGWWTTRAGKARTVEDLLRELERALARTGRPLTDATTLAALEHRFRGSPRAAAYLRGIRLERYGGAGKLPDDRLRRALRAELAAGLGFAARTRALWALPPRPPRLRVRWRRHLHSS